MGDSSPNFYSTSPASKFDRLELYRQQDRRAGAGDRVAGADDVGHVKHAIDVERTEVVDHLSNSLLKNAILAFLNLAKCGAEPHTARKITTCVAILSSHPCDVAACRINQQAAKPWAVPEVRVCRPASYLVWLELRRTSGDRDTVFRGRSTAARPSAGPAVESLLTALLGEPGRGYVRKPTLVPAFWRRRES